MQLMGPDSYRRSVVLLTLGVFLSTVHEASGEPSFDCDRATTPDEKAICDVGTLSQIDSMVASAYRTYKPQFQSKRSVARRLLQDRRSCGSDKVCIASAQLSALNTYGGNEPWVQNYVVAEISARAAAIGRKGSSQSSGMPAFPGDCVKTLIKEITTRFEEPISYENQEAGTSVQYSNDGYVFSYDRGAAFYNARAGQPVVMCLLSSPYDCPDGDDRGRMYYTFNLATKGEWILPDAQHMCGGK
jgi:uncharacterized protein